jgi:hypothetical protein
MRIMVPGASGKDSVFGWMPLFQGVNEFAIPVFDGLAKTSIMNGTRPIRLQFRTVISDNQIHYSGIVQAGLKKQFLPIISLGLLMKSILMLVGCFLLFVAALGDTTSFKSARGRGEAFSWIYVPALFAFFAFFWLVTISMFSARIPDILIAEDVPWDPVTMLEWVPDKILAALLLASLGLAMFCSNVLIACASGARVFQELVSVSGSGMRKGLLLAGITAIMAELFHPDRYAGWLHHAASLFGPMLAIMMMHKIFEGRIISGRSAVATRHIHLPAFLALILGLIICLLGQVNSGFSIFHDLVWLPGSLVAVILFYTLGKMFNAEKSNIN